MMRKKIFYIQVHCCLLTLFLLNKIAGVLKVFQFAQVSNERINTPRLLESVRSRTFLKFHHHHRKNTSTNYLMLYLFRGQINIKTYKNHTNNTFTPIVYNGAKEFTIDAFSDMSKHI